MNLNNRRIGQYRELMKIIFAAFLLTFIFSVDSFAREPLWSILPNGCVQMPQEVSCNPMQVGSAQELTFFLSVSGKEVSRRVGMYGYKPIEISGIGAIAVINVIKYDKTSFGSYSEYVLSFPVQKLNDNLYFSSLNQFVINSQIKLNDIRNPRIVYFMDRLILDKNEDYPNEQVVKFAIENGRKIYGYPKERGSIQIDYEGDKKKFTVKSSDGLFMITLTGHLPPLDPTLRIERNVHSLTIKNGKPILSYSTGTVRTTRVLGNKHFSDGDLLVDAKLAHLNLIPLGFVFQENERWAFGPLQLFL